MNSNTRCKFPLCGNASINSTILGSLSSLRSFISLRAVKFTPSFCLPSRIFLIATVCPVCQHNEFISIRIPHHNITIIFIIEQMPCPYLSPGYIFASYTKNKSHNFTKPILKLIKKFSALRLSSPVFIRSLNKS